MLYLIQVCEIDSLAQLVQLSLVWDGHLGGVFYVREGMGGACSPPASPRGGLRRDVVREAALHYCSRQLLLVLLRHSVGFLLLYAPVLINRKQHERC